MSLQERSRNDFFVDQQNTNRRKTAERPTL